MLEQVDYIAQVEHRTRSDLIRESLRRYLENFKRKEYGTATSVLNAAIVGPEVQP